MRREHADALEVAFAANSADLLRYLTTRTRVPEDAADALGDAMVAAWRNVARLPDDPTEARMWLFVTARNALRNVDRGRRRRNAAEQTLADALTTAAPTSPPPDDAIAVRIALDALPPHLAELLRLVHWDGFTLREAAELLDAPAATIRSQHVRAKELLRSALAVPTRSSERG